MLFHLQGLASAWRTLAAEPLVGSAADAPQPYDPKTVKSIVRWGTRSGSYDRRAQGDDSLVYTYFYPKSGCSSRGREGRLGGLLDMAGQHAAGAGVARQRLPGRPTCQRQTCAGA